MVFIEPPPIWKFQTHPTVSIWPKNIRFDDQDQSQIIKGAWNVIAKINALWNFAKEGRPRAPCFLDKLLLWKVISRKCYQENLLSWKSLSWMPFVMQNFLSWKFFVSRFLSQKFLIMEIFFVKKCVVIKNFCHEFFFVRKLKYFTSSKNHLETF